MIGAIGVETGGYGYTPRSPVVQPSMTQPAPNADGGGENGSNAGNNVYDPYSTSLPPSRQAGKGDTPRELWEKYRCRTCENRTYQDGSNDPGVSMKTPTKVAPQNAAAAVMGHEQQHVSRNALKAESEGRRVISSSVTIHSGVCGECGKTYVAGGTTRTVTAEKQKPQQQKTLDTRA